MSLLEKFQSTSHDQSFSNLWYFV